jgi:hypothetical protein
MTNNENHARYWLTGAAKLIAPVLAEFSTKTVDIPAGKLDAAMAAMERIADAVDELWSVFEDDE